MTKTIINGISVDLSRDSLFDIHGLQRLKDSYMRDDEVSPQERFSFVASSFSSNKEHAQRIYDYASKHWLSFSTPVFSFGKNSKGLPISCFLVNVTDTAQGLVDSYSEVSWLSMLGGGVGIGFNIRAADEKSTGVMSHLKTYDASSLAYRQGKTRRGSYAVYLDISHPDIVNFLEMRKPTGDQNLRALNLHHGINISDKFMEIIEKCMVEENFDDSWDLICPHTNQIKETVSAKSLWEKILELRMHTGEPYIHFIDESNRHLPKFQKDMGLSVRQSNLCSEIVLATNKERTAVCCLSSVNLEYYDEWKSNKMFIRDILEFLDNVLQYFIDNAPDTISRAKYSAMRERSVGLGALGFHAYLQQKNIPFESALAKSINNKIFKQIREECDDANHALAAERGEAPDALGYGVRFSHMLSIAPNASTSILMGNTSPSVEPFRANAYRQDTMSGSFLNKNKYLDKIIKDKCSENSKLDYEEIWSSIISHDGSVQHLEFLDDYTKDVFKTAIEIDQRWIVEHAGDRQKYIDQAQSINLFFKPDVNVKYLHVVHYMAWRNSLKTLYYCRSEKIGKVDKVAEKIERQRIEDINLEDIVDNEENSCLACEG